MVCDLRSRVYGLKFRVNDLWLRVYDFGVQSVLELSARVYS